MEGFVVTGQSAQANKLWEVEADNFDDAVAKYNEYTKVKNGKPSAVKGALLDGKTMRPVPGWTVWGCRLFDNEKDARKSFG